MCVSIGLFLGLILEFECALIANELILCECLLIFEFHSPEGDNLLTLRHKVVLKVHFLKFGDSKPQIYIVSIDCAVQLLQVDAALTVAQVSYYTKSELF